MNRFARYALLLPIITMLAGLVYADTDYLVKLNSGAFQPPALTATASQAAAQVVGKHILIQFDRVLSDNDKESLKNAGVELLDYVPENSWIAVVNQAPSQSQLERHGVRWLGTIAPEQKLSRLLTEYEIQPSARRGGDKVQFTVVAHSDVDSRQLAEQLQTQFAATIVGYEPSINAIELIIAERHYRRVAEFDAVQWIEPAPPEPVEHNNSCRDNLTVTTVQAAPYNLDGEGFTVAEWDGGSVWTGHSDFSGRVTVLDGSGVSGHATHVAGTVIGDGNRSSGTYKGMAPAANLVSQQWWNSGSEASGEYQDVINNYGASLATNSWGYGAGNPATQASCQNVMGDYYSVCASLDNIVRGSSGGVITICWSAGNDRGSSTQYCGSLGWTYGTVSPPGTAKNVITVGAVNSNNSSMTSFSSWGPTDDGRLKPDIVGPGCQSSGDGGVTSTSTSNGYTTLCGTSMSTPAVAGLITLLYQQRYLSSGSSEILPSTIKGILMNSATDLGAVGPDYQYGHGLAHAERAVKKVASGTPSWVEGLISTGSSVQYDLVVPSGASKLKATLVWDDPGATSISGVVLVNDIDLILIDPFGAETRPWVLNPASPGSAATRGTDRINNAETAEVSNPAPGLWKARVNGYNIPQGPQKYSLVFTPDSIYQPGNTRAMSVAGPSDQSINPGMSTNINFWVGNVGGTLDSIRVRISDSQSWLTATTDTVIILNPYDSLLYTVTVNVPAPALFGDTTIVTCLLNSRSDSVVTAVDRVTVSTAPVYLVVADQPSLDTAASPENYLFSLKIHNNGNIANTIDIQPVSADGWLVTPTLYSLVLNPRDSGAVAFTVQIPEEVAHLSTHIIDFPAMGNGGAGDTATLSLVVANAVFPPTLVSPDTVLYTQNRQPTFEWDGAADSYTLFIGTDTTMSTVLKSFPGLTNTSFTLPVPDALADGQYFWAVKKFVGGDSSSVQRFPRRLVVDNIAPSPLDMYSPANGAILSEKVVTFTYSEANSSGPGTAPEYGLLQIAADSTFTNTLATIQPVTGTSHQYPDTLAEGKWFWRAQRIDLAGNVSLPSTAPSFLVDTRPPSLPVMTSPANGAFIATLPAKLRWQGTAPVAWQTSREYYYVAVASDPDFNSFVFSGYVFADSLLLNAPPLVEGQTYYWQMKALDSAQFYTAYTTARSFKYQSFICGDINNSHTNPDLTDLSMLISYLISGSPTLPVPQAASLNCDPIIDLTDLSTLINYLLGGTPTLCCQ